MKRPAGQAGGGGAAAAARARGPRGSFRPGRAHDAHLRGEPRAAALRPGPVPARGLQEDLMTGFHEGFVQHVSIWINLLKCITLRNCWFLDQLSCQTSQLHLG